MPEPGPITPEIAPIVTAVTFVEALVAPIVPQIPDVVAHVTPVFMRGAAVSVCAFGTRLLDLRPDVILVLGDVATVLADVPGIPTNVPAIVPDLRLWRDGEAEDGLRPRRASGENDGGGE